MGARGVLVLALLAGVAAAGEPYPEVVGRAVGPERHAFWPVRVRRLERIEWAWSEGSRAGFAAPIADGLLLIQGGGGGIRGVEAGTGKRWWIDPGSTSHWNYSACVLGPGGIAYGGNFGWVRAVDRKGKRLWRTDLQCAWIHSPPAVSPDGKALYCSGDGLGIASLDTATGAVNWMRRDFRSPGNRYVFDAQGNVIAAHHHATVCYAADGRERWRIDEPLREPMRVGSRLVALRHGDLCAWSLDDRRPLWSVRPPAGVTGIALRDDGRIVAALDSGALALVRPADGAIVRHEGVADAGLGRPATVLGAETLVADAQGTLYLVGEDLRVVSSIPTGGKPYGWRPVVTADGHVLLNHADTVLCIGGTAREGPPPLVATEWTIVADDFVVDVWHNGRKVPDGARQMLAEVFGATIERDHVNVRKGDWLVFHVVANRLRWNGSSYFGLSGRDAAGNRTLVSTTRGGWSSCDDPAEVARFIAERNAGADRGVVAPERPWGSAPGHWRAHDGEDFTGEPVWGRAWSTWLKLRVDGPGPPPDPFRWPDGYLGPRGEVPPGRVHPQDPQDPPPPPEEPGVPGG